MSAFTNTDLDLGSQKISNLADGVAADDAATVGQLGGGAGALLASFKQTGGTNQNTTSATQADVDATNAVITFTAPASGAVLVRVTCVVQFNNAAGLGQLGLRESTTDIAGPFSVVLGNTTAGQFFLVSPVWKITGLTPSSSHTYKLAFSRTSAGTFTVHQTGSGASEFPIVFEVWSA